MRWFGPSSIIEIEKREDGLMVHVAGQRRAIDVVTSGFIFLIVGVMLWRYRSWMYLVFTLGSAVWCFLYWFRDRKRELWVTERYLEVRRDHGGVSATHIRMQWTEILGLEYRAGGEDEDPGLYAREGYWRGTCLVPYLDKEQSDDIIVAIYAQFPDVKVKDDDGSWSLFSEKSGLTTLGLLGPKK
jgi:hypothetical protein